jgi:hypothetical protein
MGKAIRKKAFIFEETLENGESCPRMVNSLRLKVVKAPAFQACLTNF